MVGDSFTSLTIPRGGRRGGEDITKQQLRKNGMRGFRMEMLGVMFFGMSMRKFFSELIKPEAEFFGTMLRVDTVRRV